jgi:hypothetical protein
VTATHATAHETGTAITLRRDEINTLLETVCRNRCEGYVPKSRSRSVVSTVTASRLAAGAHDFSIHRILNAALQFPKAPPTASHGHAAGPGP